MSRCVVKKKYAIIAWKCTLNHVLHNQSTCLRNISLLKYPSFWVSKHSGARRLLLVAKVSMSFHIKSDTMMLDSSAFWRKTCDCPSFQNLHLQKISIRHDKHGCTV